MLFLDLVPHLIRETPDFGPKANEIVDQRGSGFEIAGLLGLVAKDDAFGAGA
jgi:hypothetical protein